MDTADHAGSGAGIRQLAFPRRDRFCAGVLNSNGDANKLQKGNPIPCSNDGNNLLANSKRSAVGQQVIAMFMWLF